jgi:hypothetical protein
MKLKLSEIRIDGGTQTREEISWDTVHEYADSIKEGVSLPPVVVFYDGAFYWLADGFHRVHGTKKAGLDSIECDVRQGAKREAVLFSVGANSGHGLKRTNADKRRAVLRLLNDEEWGKWSQHEIARRCNVTQQCVSKIKLSLTTVVGENSDSEPKYTTKHGTVATMNTANIGKSKPVTHYEQPIAGEELAIPEKTGLEEFANILTDRLKELLPEENVEDKYSKYDEESKKEILNEIKIQKEEKAKSISQVVKNASTAIRYAETAIRQLEMISKDDPKRIDGLNMVKLWINERL